MRVAVSCKSKPPLTFLYRKPFANQYSIENYFGQIQTDLHAFGLANETLVAPAQSKGILPRLRILLSVARHRSRVLHVTGDITFAALAAYGKVVITIHDCEVLTRLPPIQRFVVKTLWYDLPVWRSDAITVNSNETARRLREVVPASHKRDLHVIHVSVSDDFQPVSRPFNKQKPSILQIGTKPNKNVGRLIQAITDMECRLVIIGPMTEDLKRRLEHSKIEYENKSNLSTSELVQTFEDSDLLAFVSTEEGFGMPIVEAQRVGRPVVTSNCSSMPEVAGEGACLVNPFDVESIRKGIQRIIGDDVCRNQLVALGRENAERFDRQKIAQQFAAVYDSVLGTEHAQSNA